MESRSGSGRITPARASTSGAPSTSVPAPSSCTALHLRADENGTSAATGRASAGRPSAIAWLVLLRAPALAASAPSSSRASSSSWPGAASTPSSRMRLSVSVPVLSKQHVSTLARLSTEFRRWASVPSRPSRTAATAKVRLVSSTRPSGTSGTRAATAVSTESVMPRSCSARATTSAIASGTIAATVIFSTVLMSRCSGLSSARVPRASEAIRSAKLSAPTCSTS